MACKINLAPYVIAEAQRQGVPPSIALAVANRESGVCHWTSSGAVKRGSAGEVGIMQLMPSTAQALGVDPYDFQSNIRGGVRYLADMYRQFGSWDLALEAYNWGPGKLQAAIASGRSAPTQVQAYASAVLGPGPSSPTISSGYVVAGQDQVSADSNNSPTATVLALLGGVAAIYALIV